MWLSIEKWDDGYRIALEAGISWEIERMLKPETTEAILTRFTRHFTDASGVKVYAHPFNNVTTVSIDAEMTDESLLSDTIMRMAGEEYSEDDGVSAVVSMNVHGEVRLTLAAWEHLVTFRPLGCLPPDSDMFVAWANMVPGVLDGVRIECENGMTVTMPLRANAVSAIDFVIAALFGFKVA